MPGANSQSGSGEGGGGTGDGGGANNGAGDGNGSGQGDANKGGNNGASNGNGGAAEGQFDPTALTQDQINQILEKNPDIWKAERLVGLRDKAGKFDKAESDRVAAENKTLEEQGKFKELSEKQTAENAELKAKLQTMTINQALTAKLSPLGVVDLEGALKLVDQSKITVDENGTITGLDEAVEALKTDKTYLFNANGNKQTTVGNGTNSNNGGGAGEPKKFKASQFRGPEGAKFYQENRKEILEAQAAGLIEQD